MAFSNSSKVLFFLSFFTNDLTAFSDHFSSCSFLASPLRHPRRRFTIGGVNGNMEVMPRPLLNNRPRPIPAKLRNQSWWIFLLFSSKIKAKTRLVYSLIKKKLVNWHKGEKISSVFQGFFSSVYISLFFMALTRITKVSKIAGALDNGHSVNHHIWKRKDNWYNTQCLENTEPAEERGGGGRGQCLPIPNFGHDSRSKYYCLSP